MKRKLYHLLLTLALLVGATTQLFAQGTAFTYQGRLNDGGNSANGIYDLRFAICDAVSGGNQIAGPFTNNATFVTNGLFIATLDFGGVFTGRNYWLDISVRTNGSGAFIELLPRQPLTPTPYAIFANTASNLSGTISAAQIVLNTNAPLLNVSAWGTFNGTFNGTLNGSIASALVAWYSANANTAFGFADTNTVILVDSNAVSYSHTYTNAFNGSYWSVAGGGFFLTNMLSYTNINGSVGAGWYVYQNGNPNPQAYSPTLIGNFSCSANGIIIGSGVFGLSATTTYGMLTNLPASISVSSAQLPANLQQWNGIGTNMPNINISGSAATAGTATNNSNSHTLSSVTNVVKQFNGGGADWLTTVQNATNDFPGQIGLSFIRNGSPNDYSYVWASTQAGLGTNAWGVQMAFPGGISSLGNPYWYDLPLSLYGSSGVYFGFGPQKSRFSTAWPNGTTNSSVQPYFNVVNANPYGGGAAINIRSGFTNSAHGQFVGTNADGANVYVSQYGWQFMEMGDAYVPGTNADSQESQQAPCHVLLKSDSSLVDYISINGHRSGEDVVFGQIPLHVLDDTRDLNNIMWGIPFQVPGVWITSNPNWKYALAVNENTGDVTATNGTTTLKALNVQNGLMSKNWPALWSTIPLSTVYLSGSPSVAYTTTYTPAPFYFKQALQVAANAEFDVVLKIPSNIGYSTNIVTAALQWTNSVTNVSFYANQRVETYQPSGRTEYSYYMTYTLTNGLNFINFTNNWADQTSLRELEIYFSSVSTNADTRFLVNLSQQWVN